MAKANKKASKAAGPTEMLLVASKVKGAIKNKDCNTAGDALDGRAAIGSGGWGPVRDARARAHGVDLSGPIHAARRFSVVCGLMTGMSR